jgi:hypothetical protein
LEAFRAEAVKADSELEGNAAYRLRRAGAPVPHAYGYITCIVLTFSRKSNSDFGTQGSDKRLVFVAEFGASLQAGAQCATQ